MPCSSHVSKPPRDLSNHNFLHKCRLGLLNTFEVPVEWAHDHSHINPLRDGLNMGVEMLMVRWNDIRDS
jgi:hypothetical protein